MEQSWGKGPVPTVIIDLSPIARLDGAARWDLVEATVKAWQAQVDRAARFYGVADNSLYYKLDAAGQNGLSEWKRKRMARSVSWADPELLELATRFSDASIVTTDLFRDHRRKFPWLQGTTRMWKPVLSAGSIRFEQLDYSPIPVEEVSWRIEEANLTPKGFGAGEVRDALRYEWACTNAACAWARKGRDRSRPGIQRRARRMSVLFRSRQAARVS
jgi:hypothetical protein